jgi:hypothetical protein
MAQYKYPQFLQRNEHDEFDANYPPGASAPNAGIYRCIGCGREIGIAQEHALPPQNHHTHTKSQGSIRWRLLVFAVHVPQ